MSLFSFLGRKKKQESTSAAPGFTSRSEEESQAYRNRSKKKPDNASQKSPTAVLPEKKRARRRLIGAIALVLAAIIGLPMLLDSEQKSVPDDIAIQIPSMDTPLPTADSHPASGGASFSGAVSNGLEQQEEIIEPAQAPATGKDIAPTEPEPAPPPPREAKPAPKITVQPKPEFKPKPDLKHESKPEHTLKPEPGHEPKNTVKIDETARARAILEGRVETAAPQKTPAKVTLQIAALATQEKVDELQGKLKAAGIASYTQKVATQSGTRIRVRVGSFGSKEDAEKMRARLVQLGYGGTIVPVR